LLLATGIAAIIDPWSKALTIYHRLTNFTDLWRASFCLLILSCGLILCTSLPDDSSVYKGAGGVFPVLLYVSFGSLFGFTSTSIFRYFKESWC
jgi:hypothetical protein